jgi:hypothetical protein
MKPPVTIDTLTEMWSKDAVIDETEPGKELLKIPQLHSKYHRIMSHHNLVVKKLSHDYSRLRLIKWQYFSGDLNNPEDLEKYKLDPFLKKVLKNDISNYIDADEDLNNILIKKVIHQEIVDICESILKELHSRTFQIKSFIEWEKFIGGQ